MSQYYHFKSTLTQNKKEQAMGSREFNTSQYTHNPRKLQPTKVIDSIKRRHQPNGHFRRRPVCRSSSESIQMADNSHNLKAYYVQHQPDYLDSKRTGGLQVSNKLDCVRWAHQNNIQVYSLHEGRKASDRSKKVSKALKPKPKAVSCLPDFLSCKQKSPKKSLEKKAGSKKESLSTKSKRSVPKSSDGSRKQVMKNPKLSWDNKVKVRYADSDLANKKRPRKPLAGSRRESVGTETNDGNVVHLKIQVPKPDESLKKAFETSGQDNDRILDILRQELLTSAVHGKSEPMTVEEAGAIIKLLTKNEQYKPKLPTPTFAQQTNPNVDFAYPMSNVVPGDGGEFNSLNSYQPGEVIGISSPPEENSFGVYGKAADIVEKPLNQKLIEQKPADQKEEEKPPVIYKDIGVSVKQEQKVVEAANECTCRNTVSPSIFEKIRNSINMTDSDNAVFDKIINPSCDPAYNGKRTKYGNVTVETHNPICDCEICTSFGTVELAPSTEAKDNNNDGLVISEKVVRVLHNNGYRNIVTHTEDCNCKICKSIKEHVLKSTPTRNYQVNPVLEDDLVYNQRYSRMEGGSSGFQRPSHDESRRCAKEPKTKRSVDSRKVTHKLVVPHCCATDLLKHYRPPVKHSAEPRRKEFLNERKHPSSSDNTDSSEEYSSRSHSRGSNRRQHNHLSSSKPFDYRVTNRLYDDRGSNSYEPTYKNRNRGMDENDGFEEFHSDDDEKSHKKYKPKRSSCLSCTSPNRGSHKKTYRKPSLTLHPAIVEESISASMRSGKRSGKTDHHKSHSSHKASRSSKRRRQSIVNAVRILGMSSHAKLHNIIRDLVKGQPSKKHPKMYTASMGYLENAPYSSIKIVNYANPNIGNFRKPGCSMSLPQTSVIRKTKEQLPFQIRDSCPSVFGILGDVSPSLNCSSRSYVPLNGERRNIRPNSCDSPSLSNSNKTTNVVEKPNKLMVRFSKLFKGKSKKP